MKEENKTKNIIASVIMFILMIESIFISDILSLVFIMSLSGIVLLFNDRTYLNLATVFFWNYKFIGF